MFYLNRLSRRLCRVVLVKNKYNTKLLTRYFCSVIKSHNIIVVEERWLMDSTRPDALEALEIEKEWLMERLERIEMAISVLTGLETKKNSETTNAPIKRTTNAPGRMKKKIIKRGNVVQWAAEVSKVFNTHLNLMPGDVLEKLTENGVPGLDDKDVRKSVYATLNRKVRQGELFQNDNGMYCKNLNFM